MTTCQTKSEIVDYLDSIRPAVDEFDLNAWSGSGAREPHFYGASWLIARELGLPQPRPCHAIWTHGWQFAPPEHVYQFLGLEKRQRITLVGVEEHARFLRARGVQGVHAVGLPFAYADLPAPVQRFPRSLLVMPGHSLSFTRLAWDEEAFVKEIAGLRGTFDQVVACVYSACVQSGRWIRTFDKYGIPWITGIRANDRNGLIRQKLMLSAFAAMTTNTIGAHILYASAVGCRVSIWGPYGNRTREENANDTLYKKFPELLDIHVRDHHETSVRKLLPQFFCHPAQAQAHATWAAAELGVCHRQPAGVMAQYFGWDGPHAVQDTIYRLGQSAARPLRSLYRRMRGAVR